MTPDALKEHVFGTYLNLRFGMAIIATVFPVAIWLVGEFCGVPLQDSLSAYYWADGFVSAPVRTWFVGGLFALAAFFYLYKGFTVGENYALNLAAIFAIGVAALPMEWQCQDCTGLFSAHGVSAVLLFACLGYVVVLRSRDTLKHLPQHEHESDDQHQLVISRYRRIYLALGTLIFLSPLVAFFVNSILGKQTTIAFFVEAVGVEAFAAFWWVKSFEMRRSRVTRRALKAEIEV